MPKGVYHVPVPKNEPVLSYAPGSRERKLLKKALEEAGVQALIIAPHSGEIQGMNHDEKADRFPVDVQLAEADPEQFDAALLPGGALNADTLRVVPEAKARMRAGQLWRWIHHFGATSFDAMTDVLGLAAYLLLPLIGMIVWRLDFIREMPIGARLGIATAGPTSRRCNAA